MNVEHISKRILTESASDDWPAYEYPGSCHGCVYLRKRMERIERDVCCAVVLHADGIPAMVHAVIGCGGLGHTCPMQAVHALGYSSDGDER